MRPLASNSKSAFTLLELLVSSAIIGLMMTVLLTATSTSLGLWRGTEQRIAVDREGRNGLALMADDLANMAELPAPTFRLGSAANNSWPNDEFMNFAVIRPADYQEAGQGNDGDVCYVYYRCVPDGPERRSFTILRSHVDSKATFESISAGSPPPAGIFEVLATNVTELYVNGFDSAGIPLSAPGDIATFNVSVGIADKAEIDNLRQGISMPDTKTSRQYFSTSAYVR